MQWLSVISPATYALRGIRAAIIDGAPVSALWGDIWPLIVIGIVAVPLGLWIFRHRRALRQAAREAEAVRLVEVEEPLEGGNFGAVVRVGDTVRRETGPWTPAVHALLRHLEAAASPRRRACSASTSAGGRSSSFVEGEVPWPPPAWLWEEDATAWEAGALARRYHEAVAGFVPPPGARWRMGRAAR